MFDAYFSAFRWRFCYCLSPADIFKRALSSELSKDQGGNVAWFFSAGPGCGKSWVLQEFFRAVLAKARERVPSSESAALKDMLAVENYVALGTSLFNGYNGGVLTGFEHRLENYTQVVANRALLSALRLPLGASLADFAAVGPYQFSFSHVLSWIASQRHVDTGKPCPLVITFGIDEAQSLLHYRGKELRLSNWLRAVLSSHTSNVVSYRYGGQWQSTTVAVIPMTAGTYDHPMDAVDLSNVYAGARRIGLPLLSMGNMAQFWITTLDLKQRLPLLSPDAVYALEWACSEIGGYPRAAQYFLAKASPIVSSARVEAHLLENALLSVRSELSDKYNKGGAMNRPQLLAALYSGAKLTLESTLDGSELSTCTSGLPVTLPADSSGQWNRRVSAPAIVVRAFIDAVLGAGKNAGMASTLLKPFALLTSTRQQGDAFEQFVVSHVAAILTSMSLLRGQPLVSSTIADLFPSALVFNGAGDITVSHSRVVTTGTLLHQFPKTKPSDGEIADLVSGSVGFVNCANAQFADLVFVMDTGTVDGRVMVLLQPKGFAVGMITPALVLTEVEKTEARVKSALTHCGLPQRTPVLFVVVSQGEASSDLEEKLTTDLSHMKMKVAVICRGFGFDEFFRMHATHPGLARKSSSPSDVHDFLGAPCHS